MPVHAKVWEMIVKAYSLVNQNQPRHDKQTSHKPDRMYRVASYLVLT